MFMALMDDDPVTPRHHIGIDKKAGPGVGSVKIHKEVSAIWK
jgi:hypothetical protein